MKTLTITQHTTPSYTTKQTPWPQRHRTHHHNRRETPFPPPRTWRLQSGAKGFTGSPKEKEPIDRNRRRTNRNNDDDDKIPDVVWKRMISRILFYVGVPLAAGFAFLQVFGVLKERGVWNVPIWLPYLTTFITFGASAMGVAYGSLSTSLDAAEEGSFLGFEQVEKNWVEMWKEDGESD